MEIIIAIVIAFAISAGICPAMIRLLGKLKLGQEVRDDGPQTHLKKQGTPTMGGLCFILAMFVVTLIFGFSFPECWVIMLVTLAMGAIGFADDFLKVAKHNTKGLLPWQKLLFQTIVVIGLCVYMMSFSYMKTSIYIPFMYDTVDLGWFYPIFIFIVVLGTTNAVNFTDGVDGLCASVTSVVTAFLIVAELILAAGEIMPVTAAALGGLLGYLIFNAYPAKVFMGDTGSLALGGFVAATFIMLGSPLLILIVGFVYLAEILSSVIQVAYFKKTHGKRFFRMAPIHHHFEKGGWSETRIVTVFTIVTILLSLIGLLGV